jgi:hypothetical protein
LSQLFVSVFNDSILLVCINSAKLNGLIEIIAGGTEFIVRKSTIISLIMFNETVGFGT